MLDITNGNEVMDLCGHYNKTSCVHYNEELFELYSGGHDRNVLIWQGNISRNEAFKEHLDERNKTVTKCDNQFDNTLIEDDWSSSDSDN